MRRRAVKDEGASCGATRLDPVCVRLVADLADRGLDASRGVLFVSDGGMALERAIRAVFGAKALIQRCRRHKERNVTDHLLEAERPLVQRRLRAAWPTPTPTKPRPSWSSWPAALTASGPVPPPPCARA
jgi:transposase-like protein